MAQCHDKGLKCLCIITTDGMKSVFGWKWNVASSFNTFSRPHSGSSHLAVESIIPLSKNYMYVVSFNDIRALESKLSLGKNLNSLNCQLILCSGWEITQHFSQRIVWFCYWFQLQRKNDQNSYTYKISKKVLENKCTFESGSDRWLNLIYRQVLQPK